MRPELEGLTNDWLLDRRISHETYPLSEAQWGSITEYVEQLELKYHRVLLENYELNGKYKKEKDTSPYIDEQNDFY